MNLRAPSLSIPLLLLLWKIAIKHVSRETNHWNLCVRYSWKLHEPQKEILSVLRKKERKEAESYDHSTCCNRRTLLHSRKNINKLNNEDDNEGSKFWLTFTLHIRSIEKASSMHHHRLNCFLLMDEWHERRGSIHVLIS